MSRNLYYSLGNHEFDNGVHGLTPFIRNLSCPVLACNLILKKVPELQNESNLRSSIVRSLNGFKIGLIGYLTPDTKILAVKNDMEYTDEIRALNKEVRKLQEKGVDILIALGHSGITKDLEIAQKVDGIDLVIGGHTNTFLWNGTSPDSEKPEGPYPMLARQNSGRIVPVVQAYAYTKYLGKIHLVFDALGEIVKYDGKPILLDKSIPQDPEVLGIVESYGKKVSNYTDKIVGNTTVVLDGRSCQRNECNLGNLIADAMVDYYASQYVGEYWTDAPIAVIQGGGIRSSVVPIKTPAAVTRGQLLTVMPFEGNIATITVNGTILLQMLEHSVAQYVSLDSPGEFLQYSGIKVEYDLKRPPGNRVVNATARCSECHTIKYYAIDPNQYYKLLMPSFVAIGGDGYSMLEGLPMKELNYNELACASYYINRHSPVHPGIEGRIVITDMAAITDSSTLHTSLGNHEFDEGVSGLTPFLSNVSTPVLVANLMFDNEPELLKHKNLKKSIVLDINSVKVGIIGYLTPETKELSCRTEIDYIDEVIAIQQEVNKLQDEGVKVLIALGHSGYLKDMEIAQKVTGIDLVIGGHSNTFLWNGTTPDIETTQGPYPTLVYQPTGKAVLVVQAYAYTKYIGKLHLKFDKNGEIVEFNGAPILLDHKIPQDNEVLNMVERYASNITQLIGEVVGTSNVTLDGSCRLHECNMGNLITDSMVDYYAGLYKGKYWTDAPIAILHSGRIRTSVSHTVKPFSVTRGDLTTVLPFSGHLVTLSMNGSTLLQSLEHSVATWQSIVPGGQFLQVSGIKVVYDLARPPRSRVAQLLVRCAECDTPEFLDIDLKKTYKVIMPAFLSDIGLGFTIFESLPKLELPYSEVTCVIDYLRKHSPVNPKVTDRITLWNETDK